MYKGKAESNSALQPVYEALQVPIFEVIKNADKVILVEGIYDKYAIELFFELSTDYTLFPGTSAASIIKNIQFLNAFGINYIAIWDNDKEGVSAKKKASQLFGEHESIRFDLLPLLSNNKRRMEGMITSKDLDDIRKKIGLPEDSTYERVISSLYFESKEIRTKIISDTSTITKNNFKILKEILDKRFKKVEQQLENRL